MGAVIKNEFVSEGHTACPGCGAVHAMRFVLNVLGAKTIVVLPACCWSVINGRVVIENGNLTTLDMRPHIERHNAISVAMINGD